ncbi:MAG TPA: hypothetical protein H9735_05455 [Candidatus Anaerostipes excrementavium]|uniref:RNA polymerase sigma factor 54 DNA-binding domain-containing protein n=1 Tax=Candidatus Anaerostipes excrementavium TaxID=2838463 RepID=A0A9D2B9V6_9FIRM|nr:hypothetical protein [uncultured Anaerostipes sp.]HIX67559.1 hypothetical protein [Candidatus Anaerostipes excrementavium]
MDLTFKTEQRQTANQSLIHKVQLLQMNRQDLLAYLEEQSMENPLLEIDDAIYQYMPANVTEDNWIERLKDTRKTVADELMRQVRMEEHSHLEMRVMEEIILSLDENGFFQEGTGRIAERCKVKEQFANDCWQKIKDLEPEGIGAADLKECLLIQLEKKKDRDQIAEEIVKNHLELLAKNHVAVIAKKVGCSEARAREACQLIQTLQPKPANQISASAEHVGYILPDFIIDREEEAYIRKKMREAGEVIRMVQSRQDTLKKVMREIVAYQKGFFTEGQKALKKLSMKEIAQTLGIHESTVSRAVNGKYFQCEWGVFAVKYLFAKGISKKQPVSEAVKTRIKELVREEDKKKPLSDQKLQQILTKEGYKISRRTVAKYRMQMNIKDASGRKNLS